MQHHADCVAAPVILQRAATVRESHLLRQEVGSRVCPVHVVTAQRAIIHTTSTSSAMPGHPRRIQPLDSIDPQPRRTCTGPVPGMSPRCASTAWFHIPVSACWDSWRCIAAPPQIASGGLCKSQHKPAQSGVSLRTSSRTAYRVSRSFFVEHQCMDTFLQEPTVRHETARCTALQAECREIMPPFH